jgi:hypothetical protein
MYFKAYEFYAALDTGLLHTREIEMCDLCASQNEMNDRLTFRLQM